jgi:16S rRNA (cytidine1402-2'-O)-methyltransferase
MTGRLFVVATPIGNLSDLSPRAIETLKLVRRVVCEDTRHSLTLLVKFGIATSTTSLPAFDEAQRIEPLLKQLESGDDLALITDAGTPAISDPGEQLVKAAVAKGIQVIPIPGPSAITTALCASGLPTGRFHFAGFLPRKQSDAEDMLDEMRPLRATLVFYEAGNRAADTIELLGQKLGNRRACIARELTKIHEQFLRGLFTDLKAQVPSEGLRGEIVILVEGATGEAPWTELQVVTALQTGLAKGERLKTLSQDIAKLAQWTSGQVYRLGLK